MRFVHIADVHLGMQVDENQPWGKNASAEIYDNFSAFVDYVEVNPIDFIFITGDLFDHVPSKEEIRWVDMELSRLKGVNIIYVTGEADFLERGADLWDYKFISPVYILNGEKFNNSVPKEEQPQRTRYSEAVVDCVYFPEYNLDIYGVCQYNSVNYRSDIEQAYARDKERINILLAHGGGEDVNPFDMDGMKSRNFNYIGVGHFHDYSLWEEDKVYYPGSLSPLSYEETGEHGFIRGYVDNFICDAKFVPFSDRQYKDLNFKVDHKITNDELVKKIDSICNQNKKYIYTINIERDSSCYTDFDLSKICDRYRIFKISGEKSRIEDLLKLGEMNSHNVFGKTILKLNELDVYNSSEILVEYSNRILKKIFPDYDNVVPMQVLDDHIAIRAQEKLKEELKSEQKALSQGFSICEEEDNKIQTNMLKNPDKTGDINLSKEKLGKIEYELTQVEFKDAQVDKIYDRRRLRFILCLVTPVVVLWIYLSTLDILVKFFNSKWDKWYHDWISTLVIIVVVAAVSFVVYNRTKKLRKKMFKTPIPAEEHMKNRNSINILEDDAESLRLKIAQLQEEQKIYKRLLKIKKDNEARRDKLENKLFIIEAILENA